MALTTAEMTWVKNRIAIEVLEKEKEALITAANAAKTIKSNEIAAIDVQLIADLQVKDTAIAKIK